MVPSTPCEFRFSFQFHIYFTFTSHLLQSTNIHHSRGKSFWKPSGGDIVDEEADPDSEEFQNRRSTRSSIKPRLLFQTLRKGKSVAAHNSEDEEAITDIEDHAMTETREDEPAGKTPLEDQSAPDTPKAPRFAPASPPTTARTTRVTRTLPSEETTPIKGAGKSRSPFDGWRRSKSGRTAAHGRKREAEVLPDEAASNKRQRA
jgi:hypothetical protein